jgi:hypothetical protein
MSEQLTTPVNVPEHAVVFADGAGEVVRVAFATIDGDSIFERIGVLEDFRDRLSKIVLAVPSGHVYRRRNKYSTFQDIN